jgi:hypothetical protein
MREFKDSITGNDKDDEDRDADERPALAQSQPQEPVASGAERTPADAAPDQRG